MNNTNKVTMLIEKFEENILLHPNDSNKYAIEILTIAVSNVTHICNDHQQNIGRNTTNI